VRGTTELNIDLPPMAGAAFEAYYDFLECHGENVNLTALSGVSDIARLHFLDSLALLSITSFDGKRCIDIGSGAGFPGLPLKIAVPSLDLTLLDATQKRIDFLTTLCAKLDLNVSCIHARAEELAQASDYREQYSIATSRAVAELNVLSELCLPFVSVGGLFIAMKAADCDSEIESASNAISTLGAELDRCVDYMIPGTEIFHRAVLIRKVKETPTIYPRRFAKIKRSPL